MIIAWNLMARSANTFDIRISHTEWQGDALCIYFSQIKQDQMGERPQDPRHLYANLLCLEICGMIALSIFWDCYAFVEGEITTLSRLHSKTTDFSNEGEKSCTPPRKCIITQTERLFS